MILLRIVLAQVVLIQQINRGRAALIARITSLARNHQFVGNRAGLFGQNYGPRGAQIHIVRDPAGLTHGRKIILDAQVVVESQDAIAVICAAAIGIKRTVAEGT